MRKKRKGYFVRIQPEGCIIKYGSDIPKNWKDIGEIDEHVRLSLQIGRISEPISDVNELSAMWQYGG